MKYVVIFTLLELENPFDKKKVEKEEISSSEIFWTHVGKVNTQYKF